MKRILGILALLCAIIVFTTVQNPKFLYPYNVQNTLDWVGLFGILAIGAAVVIITGGIDLSIGSVVGLVGCLLPWLLVKQGWGVAPALLAVVAVSALIGLTHGLLITQMRLQPFVVTLCGFMFYRGIARWFTDDDTQGFGNAFDGLRQLALYKLPVGGGYAIPLPFLIMAGIALVLGLFLNGTVYGRYLFALGRNEQAARFSGINTSGMTVVAYVISSLLAGLGGVLFALSLNSVQPSGHGQSYELYAIAAAVLGGCSLRGGEGSILGVVIGTAVIRTLYNANNLLGIPTQLEMAIIALVILAGVVTDEFVKRYAAHRRAVAQSRALADAKAVPA